MIRYFSSTLCAWLHLHTDRECWTVHGGPLKFRGAALQFDSPVDTANLVMLNWQADRLWLHLEKSYKLDVEPFSCQGSMSLLKNGLIILYNEAF